MQALGSVVLGVPPPLARQARGTPGDTILALSRARRAELRRVSSCISCRYVCECVSVLN